MPSNKGKEIILGVTGSIAAYKACDIVNRLREEGFGVTVVMTKEAAHFISPLTLTTLSGNKAVTEMFEPPDNYEPLHTSLADKASLVLVAPATASVIGKIASGICDDILSLVITATKAPVLIAPAMNDRMYRHKSVEDNIKKLKAWGLRFIGPETGRLACGKRAVGHIAGVETIINEVKKMLK